MIHHKYLKDFECEKLSQGFIIKVFPVKSLYFKSKCEYYHSFTYGKGFYNIVKNEDGWRKYIGIDKEMILECKRSVEFVFLKYSLDNSIHLHRIKIDGVNYELLST